jgi:RHS repeat-associated protein
MLRLLSEFLATILSFALGVPAYAYPVGNRKQITSTLAPVPAGLWNYDANDRFTAGDTYDADGNTVSSGGITNVYDFENHLIQKAGVTIVYDGDGNRVSKTVAGVTTTYLVDTLNPTGYAQVVYETLNGSRSGNYELNHSYVYGLELISQTRSYVANFQSATQKIYYVYDGHGSVRALTDPTGAVTDTYDYDAFGNLIHSTGTTPNNYLFAGEQFDPDLNLYYNRARYLNTNTGRFWTMDSFEGNYELPLSLHKYVYSQNDTVDFADPSGQLLSTLAYGKTVHDALGLDFERKVPGGIYNLSVKSILGIKVPGLRLRPDLTDTINHLGYEIKPVGSAAQGAAQLAGYLFALTLFDPNKNVWLPGELYLPPTLMLLNDHAVALVSPPVAGVIIYEVIDEVEITGIVAAATAALGADLAGSFAVATLVEAY